MNKRMIWGSAALLMLATAVTPLVKVFAADSVLDYANSMGAIDDSNTINRVVTATTDGGYIVGGQAAQCLYMDTDKGVTKVSKDEECIKYYTDNGLDASTYASVADRCTRIFAKSTDISGRGALPAERYEYTCIDYLAKFKANGAREWLTLLKDDEYRPLAVGETQDDYRMYTGDYTLYTFDKATGEFKTKKTVGVGFDCIDAEFDTNGSIWFLYGDNIGVLDKNAENYRTVLASTKQAWLYAQNLVMDKNYVYATYEYYDETTAKNLEEIVKISKETLAMTALTKIADGRWSTVMSGDNMGNFIVLTCSEEDEMTNNGVIARAKESEPNTYGADCKLISMDKNGNILAEKTEDELGALGSAGANFVFYDSTRTLTKLNSLLEVEYSYNLATSESISDVAVLNDGSLIAVGLGEASTDNYAVEGDGNGIQMRLGAVAEEVPEEPGDIGGDVDEPNDETVKNPNTIDNIQLVALGSAIVLVGATLAMRKLFGRR